MQLSRLSNDPGIIIVDNFVSTDLCNLIINNYKKKVTKKSMTSGFHSNHRTSSSHTLERDCPEMEEITINLSSQLFSDINFFEKPQIHKYEENQEYHEHYDARDLSKIDDNNFNQRRNTAIIYLNDDFLGGCTYFNYKRIKITPKKGRLLLFENCFKGTDYIHPLSMHSGLKVKKGTKWILTLWSRKRFFINLDNL